MHSSTYLELVLVLYTAIFLVFVAPSVASADQVDLVSSQDNTLYEGPNPLSNGAGAHMFVGTTGQSNFNVRRGLLAFDVASAIPSGAVIDSVELRLYVSNTSSQSVENIQLHRVTRSWGEATTVAPAGQGSGGVAVVGDCTWTHAIYPSVPWATAGGDYLPTPTASTPVSTAGGHYTWVSNPELVNDVTEWLQNPTQNFGWILIGDEVGIQTSKRFDTREQSFADRRPRLRVVYNSEPDFIRGDCNHDGAMNVADAVYLLSVIFPVAAPLVPECDDACDTNADTSLNLGDAVRILVALFTPSAPIPSPHPGCGPDTGFEELICAAYSHCP